MTFNYDYPLIDFSGKENQLRELTDSDWETIIAQKEPFVLKLNYTTVSDEDLARLHSQPFLRAIDLDSTQISAAGLAHLEKMASLESIIFQGAQMAPGKARLPQESSAHGDDSSRDELFEDLNGFIGPFVFNFEHLVRQWIFSTEDYATTIRLNGFPDCPKELGVEDWKRIEPEKKRFALNLSFTNVKDTDLQKLAGLDGLFSLNLADTHITYQGLQHLESLTGLLELNLMEARIKANELSVIGKLKSLQALYFGTEVVKTADLPLLASLKELRALSGVEVRGTKFSNMRDLSHLRALAIVCAPKRFHYLKELTHLEVLSIIGYSERIKYNEKKALRFLSGMTSLRALQLSDIGILTDKGLDCILPLENLEVLDTGWGMISHKGLGKLKVLGNIRRLSLKFAQVNDIGLVHITAMKRLEMLDFSQNTVLSDAGLAYLPELPQLRFLDLSTCKKITSAGIAFLSNCPNLEHLNISYNPHISEKAIPFLQKMKSLRSLGWAESKITDKGLAELCEMTQLESLDIILCNNITRAGLKHLSKLVNLRYLNIIRLRHIQYDDVSELRESLPNCNVVYHNKIIKL